MKFQKLKQNLIKFWNWGWTPPIGLCGHEREIKYSPFGTVIYTVILILLIWAFTKWIKK